MPDVESVQQLSFFVGEKLIACPKAGFQPRILERRIHTHGANLNPRLLKPPVEILQLT
jgi:hypothetical protein